MSKENRVVLFPSCSSKVKRLKKSKRASLYEKKKRESEWFKIKKPG